METLEFLGGRYNRPEQIMSGPVQAFRAQSAANGRTVFIHRVSTSEAPEEQSALLKLLTLALVKSSEAKRLVLDFGEERGYWYVVTESEPQCALLREWLQLEIDALSGPQRSPAAKASMPTVMRPPHAAAARPPLPNNPAVPAPTAELGEFTRFLQSRPSGLTSAGPSTPQPQATQSAPPQTTLPAPAGEFVSSFLSEATEPQPGARALPTEVQTPEVKPSPGEFTRFFKPNEIMPGNRSPGDGTPGQAAFEEAPIREAALPNPAPPQRPASVPPPFIPPPPPPAKPQPGEFTRFFTDGLPAGPPKLSEPSIPERAVNNPHVQRPNLPLPSLPKDNETGEFTRMFSRPQGAPAQSPPPDRPLSPQPSKRADPFGFSRQELNPPEDATDNLFSDTIEVGQPMQETQKPESEFTKIFGSMGSAAPAMTGPSVVAAPNDKPLLDERGPTQDSRETERLPAIKPQTGAEPPLSDSGPSEFTMMMQGGNAAQKPAGGTPASAPSGKAVTANAPKAGAGLPPLNFQAPPVALPPLTPHAKPAMNASASPAGASASSAFGSASVSGPQMPPMKLPQASIPMAGAPPVKSKANQKLIIFFALLAVLTILLIVVILFVMKSK